jgi:prevent-host-death family protein
MKALEASQIRKGFSDALNTVAYRGERIAIHRHGKQVAVLVPVEDVAMLEALEDRIDVAMAKKALKDKGSIPWSQVKRKAK